jgi:formate dehydrogenase subunit delta
VNPERLAEMANDIANFFAAEPDRNVAIDGMRSHLKKFWEPRMRRQIVAYLRDHGGAGMSDLAREAVARLGETEAAAASASPRESA